MQQLNKDNEILFLGDWYLTGSADASRVVDSVPFVFNLEAPISRRGIPTPGKVNLRMESNKIIDCFGLKPTAVCLANNHIMDYGMEALEDTLAELIGLDVPFYGCGNEENNFNNPAIVGVGAHFLALMGYVCPSTHPVFAQSGRWGVCQLDINRIHADIQKAKDAGATRIVVSIHWGAEDIPLPKPIDISIAHRLIDMGVDVIVGHHAHVPQPVERYKDKPIAYGLGNLAMDDIVVPRGFDELGKPTPIFRKIQTGPNRMSFGLQWNIATGYWRTRELLYYDDKVLEQPFPRGWIRYENVNGQLYGIRYKVCSRSQRIIQLYSSFKSNPRIPRLHHIKSLTKLLLRGVNS